MALSYVLVTLFIVLVIEGILLTAAFYLITRSPLLGYLALERADHAAQVYALQAAIYADGERLNPQTTFEPVDEATLTLRQEQASPELWYMHLDIPYIEPGDQPPERTAFALLIDPGEQIVASSYPARYPLAADVASLLPEEVGLIRNALAETPDGAVRMRPEGTHAASAYTVRDEDGQPIGAVYVQAPAGGFPNANVVSDVGAFLVPSGIAWLCLMLPIGLFFGVLTTRGLIRRIERLAQATARFTGGDFAQRVPVGRSDEIGQLEGQFNTMAEQLVDSFAQRQAMAEESARREERARIEQEMTSAHYVQQSLLPEQVPSIDGWQIEPYYDPARDVGGDLYDFIYLPDGRLGIVIGDVSGKGMPAALIMATTCAMMRTAAKDGYSPGQVLRAVNDLLQDYVPSGTFVTCFYAILDPSNSSLWFANAGHDIPYLSRNGEIIELRARGMPLGLMPGQSYPEEELVIDPNDVVLFYSDGLVEAHNIDREIFGFPRLQSLMKDHSHTDDLIKFLLNELEQYTGGVWEQEDDLTLIMLRRIA